MADLPLVQKAVHEQSQEVKIGELSMTKEKGNTIFTVEMIVSGRTKKLLLDANGKVIAIEEQINIEALPLAAKAGIEQQAGNGKIMKVEAITKGDAIAEYEAHNKRDGKLIETRLALMGN
jgi:hypothetical protein